MISFQVFPASCRPIDVRTHIVEAEGVDGGVSGLGIEMSGIDQGDFLPGGNLRRGDIGPVLAAITR